ncbi:MAG: enoyl-CoA hydratase/isomerase family protein [Deltaproteobacteria bacterium]|nr:enoyl-CoA hydratase/isomerase family protein [Deltaproteobacteria bacterium]
MGAVNIQRIGKTAVVTINRPEASNALNLDVWTGLADAWNLAREDDEIWTLVVTGAGNKAFCAGADLKETAERKAQAEREGRPFTSAMPLQTPMRGLDMPKPVIAAINGVAAGGGMELALACDIRIAADHVRMGLPEVARGLIPAAGGCVRLPRLIPYGLAIHMLCTGDFISAQEAYRIGLVNQVVPGEDLLTTALALAEKINENAPLAVRAVKEGATASLQVPLSEALKVETLLLSRVRQSEDSWEGPRAFSEKRKPVYKGR